MLCYEISQIKFLQYIVFFLSRDVLNQFQYGFILSEGMVFVAIGGGGGGGLLI